MSSSKKTKKKPKFIVKLTKKQQQRMNNSKSRQNETDKIYEFVKYYDTQSLDNTSIILESNYILEQLDLPRHHNRNELLYKYEALKIIMEKRLIDTYNSDFDYIYPDYYDSKFNTKIFSKKEFRLNKIPKKDVMTSDEKETHSQQIHNTHPKLILIYIQVIHIQQNWPLAHFLLHLKLPTYFFAISGSFGVFNFVLFWATLLKFFGALSAPFRFSIGCLPAHPPDPPSGRTLQANSRYRCVSFNSHHLALSPHNFFMKKGDFSRFFFFI